MSTHTVVNDHPLTAKQELLTDQIGNEVYASHYAERKAYRLILTCGTVLLCGSMWLNWSLAHRPVVNRYVRIDEMGRAQAIQYSDLNYSPREGEVRRGLIDWATYRYTISHDTIGSQYKLNYYFLSQPLSAQLMGQDNANHKESQVLNGQVEQNDVDVKSVTITSMSQEMIQKAIVARGTALVTLDKVFTSRYSRQPRTEHWLLSVTYYVNPQQVSEQAKSYPRYETLNPLGLTITEFHENLLSVDPVVSAPTAALQPVMSAPSAGVSR